MKQAFLHYVSVSLIAMRNDDLVDLPETGNETQKPQFHSPTKCARMTGIKC